MRHANGVAVFQRDVVPVVASLAQPRHIDRDRTAIANERDRRTIGVRGHASSAVDRLVQRHGHVGEDLRPRGAHFAFYIGAAASEGLDSHRHLRITNVWPQR
ncbi:hypothetical protein D3C86_1624290 [compost metagenome]